MSDQLTLGDRALAPEGTAPPLVVPSLVEFTRDGVAWRCSRFDGLAAEFEVTPPDLPGLVAAAQATARGWLVMRRLFGIQPVSPPPTTALEDLQPWTRPQLQEALGLTRKQLGEELNAVRGAWQALRPRPELPPLAPAPGPATGLFTEDELLERHGLTLKFGSSAERTWFCQRVQDYEKILAEKFAAVLGRNAVLAELRIYQLDALMNNPDKCAAGDTVWHMNLKVRGTLAEQYQKLLEQIKGLCPWAGAIAGKYAFAGAVADITRGIQEYYARGDTALIDGMCTLTEVLVDVRMSVQSPLPHYRADVRLYVIEAKARLWDFKAASGLELPALRFVQMAWQGAFLAVSEAAGGRVPDLAADGPEGEFDDLPAATLLIPSTAPAAATTTTT